MAHSPQGREWEKKKKKGFFFVYGSSYDLLLFLAVCFSRSILNSFVQNNIVGVHENGALIKVRKSHSLLIFNLLETAFMGLVPDLLRSEMQTGYS